MGNTAHCRCSLARFKTPGGASEADTLLVRVDEEKLLCFGGKSGGGGMNCELAHQQDSSRGEQELRTPPSRQDWLFRALRSCGGSAAVSNGCRQVVRGLATRQQITAIDSFRCCPRPCILGLQWVKSGCCRVKVTHSGASREANIQNK